MGKGQDGGLQKLKQQLRNEPLLKYPDFSTRFVFIAMAVLMGSEVC
jgi:hypothetical protein